MTEDVGADCEFETLMRQACGLTAKTIEQSKALVEHLHRLQGLMQELDAMQSTGEDDEEIDG